MTPALGAAGRGPRAPGSIARATARPRRLAGSGAHPACSGYARRVRLAIVSGLGLALVLVTSAASAAPPEPSGPHPRMLLDAKLRAAWKAALDDGRGPLVGAITLCDEDKSRRDHDGALYMGSEWAKMLQACLVAWAATDKHEYGVSALQVLHRADRRPRQDRRRQGRRHGRGPRQRLRDPQPRPVHRDRLRLAARLARA